MASPHLRRRYRATGGRPGLIYLFVVLAIAAGYVAQRVFTDRERVEIKELQDVVDQEQKLCEQLAARRDSLLSLAVIEPRAEKLGLLAPELDQLARLPLDAPVLYQEPEYTDPSNLAEAVGRVWQWLDSPTISATEARAGE